jgi:hypothetical protein
MPNYGYDNSNNNDPKAFNFNNYRLKVIQTESSVCHMAFVYTL